MIDQHTTRVADLTTGSEISGVYACVGKQKLTAKSGSSYLAVELRDASGKISGRAFSDASFLDSQFDRGDVVRVSGRVESFKDERQLNLRAITRVDDKAAAGPHEFLPTAYRDIDELEGFFEHLASEVHDPQLRPLLDALLSDPQLREALRRAPCTRDGHHAYVGGLIEHSVAVATLAQQTWDLHRRLDSDLLICAALLHDIGKTREFKLGVEIETTQEGRLLGHMQLGVEILRELGSRVGGIDRPRELALLNCLLSHHGPAPGQRFSSAEALALHRINALDAQVKDSLEHGTLGAR